ncbi:MAG: hypothetical protein HYY67_07915 [Thaumarchaeota archaeon]|nr:hypothetical protein [Nitrososphaerota archaeon]
MSTRRSFLKIAVIATTTESVLDGKELTFERTQSGLIDVETGGTWILSGGPYRRPINRGRD